MTRHVWRVTRHDDRWQVRRDGAARATRTFDRKQAAVAAGRSLARDNAPSRLVVHGLDGRITDHADFGYEGLSYAGIVDGPEDLGSQSEKYLAEKFTQADAGGRGPLITPRAGGSWQQFGNKNCGRG